jgi:hypothetical protein
MTPPTVTKSSGGGGSGSGENPKIVTKVNKPNTDRNKSDKGDTCEADCQYDLALINARQALRDTMFADLASTLAYLLAIFADAASGNEMAELSDIFGVVTSGLSFVTDLISWSHGNVPAWLTNAIGYAKVAIGVLNVVSNFLPFFGGIGSLLKGFTSTFVGMGKELYAFASSLSGIVGGTSNILSGLDTVYPPSISSQDMKQQCISSGALGCK